MDWEIIPDFRLQWKKKTVYDFILKQEVFEFQHFKHSLEKANRT